jgi:hypothetical protein
MLARVLIAAILIAIPAAAANAEGLEAGGSVRTYAVQTEYPGDGGKTSTVLSMLRLKISGEISDALKGEFAYEATPAYSDSTGDPASAAGLYGPVYRYDDLNETLYPGSTEKDDRLVVLQNLDRAFLTYTHTKFDLYAGRQPIAFGSARAVNPTDVIAPYTYATIAKEERTGVDAVRVRVPTGEFTEADAGYIAGPEDDPGSRAVFLRYRGYVMETDVTVMAVSYGDNRMAGFDVARALGGASVWLEATYTKPADSPAYTDDEPYVRATAGADHALSDTVYAFAEFHFNGPGTSKEDEYVSNTRKAAYSEGAVYLVGRHYIAPGVSWDMTPLLKLTASALMNLDDGSALLSPSLEMSLSDETTASLGAYAGVGDGPGNFGVQRSEFGSYPDIYYASLKYYF